MKRTSIVFNMAKRYSEEYAAHMAGLTGKPTVTASYVIAAVWGQQGFVFCSALRSLATNFSKSHGFLLTLMNIVAVRQRATTALSGSPHKAANSSLFHTNRWGLAVLELALLRSASSAYHPKGEPVERNEEHFRKQKEK